MRTKDMLACVRIHAKFEDRAQDWAACRPHLPDGFTWAQFKRLWTMARK